MPELLLVLIHIIHQPAILAVVALLLVIALREEIGNWIGRKFFGIRRR